MRVADLLTLFYSPQTSYPAGITDGTQLIDAASTVEELKETFFAFSTKQAEIVSIDKVIEQANPMYNNIEMKPIVSDSRLASLGYTKRFNIALNKFIFINSSGNEVPAPI